MATKGIDKKQLGEELKTAGLFTIGMIGGAQISRLLQKRKGVGELLDGLDGFSKRMVAPAITMAAGTAMGVFLPKKELRTVGFGMAAMGGALTANAMGAKVLPIDSAPIAVPATVKGLGYTMEALPDPSVFGLDGDPSFVDANGNVFDASGNLVNGLGEYRDAEGNLYDDYGNPINGVGETLDYGNVYDAEGNLLMGYTEGEGEIGGDGSLPGLGDLEDYGAIPGIGSTDDYNGAIPGIGSAEYDLDEDDGIDGLGNFDEEYNMLTGTLGMPAYDLEL